MHDIPPHSNLLLGGALAARIKADLTKRISQMKAQPRLAIIHASSDPAADMYVRLKQQFGHDIGANVDVLDEAASHVQATVERLNADNQITGIIVQLPLPSSVDTEAILQSIEPSKDVDGLTQHSPFTTAGPRGIMQLFREYEISLHGKRIVLAGPGRVMGGPLLPLLEAAGADVDVLTVTRPFGAGSARGADIIIGATGVPGLLRSEWIPEGTIVIDATGVDASAELEKRTDIRLAPARGGIGPLTVAALFQNLVEAAER